MRQTLKYAKGRVNRGWHVSWVYDLRNIRRGNIKPATGRAGAHILGTEPFRSGHRYWGEK